MDTLSPPLNRSLLYGQITEDFRERILSGELKAGERLPSFTEMRRQHRVSQATLNRVHSLLEAEGLISRKRGLGTFVTDFEANRRNENGVAERVSFLSNAVVILTPFKKPMANHRSEGWLEWIAQGASEAVQNAGMHAISLNPEVSDVEIERLIAENPFGALIPANLSDSSQPLAILRKLNERGVAVVAFGNSPALAECDHVLSDHESGAYQLTRLLIERGKTRIVNVQPCDINEAWLADRHRGYAKAMREAGLEAAPALLIPQMPDLPSVAMLAQGESEGFDLTAKLQSISSQDHRAFESQVRALAGYFVEAMVGQQPVEALLATTDRDAFRLAQICRLYGKTPNQDVAITGYDNFYADCEERLIAPFVPLATVDKCNRAIGAEMMKLLLDRIGGRLPDAPQTRVIRPKLVIPAP